VRGRCRIARGSSPSSTIAMRRRLFASNSSKGPVELQVQRCVEPAIPRPRSAGRIGSKSHSLPSGYPVTRRYRESARPSACGRLRGQGFGARANTNSALLQELAGAAGLESFLQRPVQDERVMGTSVALPMKCRYDSIGADDRSGEPCPAEAFTLIDGRWIAERGSRFRAFHWEKVVSRVGIEPSTRR